MTGRELIIHILENNLEDEQIFQDGKIAGFMTASEAAVKLNVGEATIRAMVDLKMLDYIYVGDTLYILSKNKE